MSRFTDKTVLITGAAGALGENMVRRFVAEDANVLIGPGVGDQVDGLLADLDTDKAMFVELDVTDESHWIAAVRDGQASFGGVDVPINNAARIAIGTTESIAVDDLRLVLETNLVGAFLGSERSPRDAGRRRRRDRQHQLHLRPAARSRAGRLLNEQVGHPRLHPHRRQGARARPARSWSSMVATCSGRCRSPSPPGPARRPERS